MVRPKEVYCLYEQKGLAKLFRDSWRQLMRNSRLTPSLQTVLGDRLHEKVAMGPRVGYWPKIKSPRSFNEKIAHRKLYTDNPLFAKISDKYEAREYVRDKAGADVLNDLHYVTDDPATIPFDELPREFVIKATHDSGSVELIHDKNDGDADKLKSLCKSWLNNRFGEPQREYWYLDIQPRIIVEEMMKSDEGVVPFDYKFFVFHGRVEFVQVDQGRLEDHKRILYDRDWNPQEFTLTYPRGEEIPPPEPLDDMISVAETLGSEFDFVRVDLYNPIGDEVRFGEMTLAPGAGEERFDPISADFEVGEYW